MKLNQFLTVVTFICQLFALNNSINKTPNYIFHHHQEFITEIDTLKYLKEEIVDKKEKYIGKEFNKLLSDLNIRPVFYFYNVGGVDENSDRSKSNGVYFHYFAGQETFNRLKNRQIGGVLVIRWQTPVDIDSVVSFAKKNGRHWNEAAADFYGKRIVKDIKLQ